MLLINNRVSNMNRIDRKLSKSTMLCKIKTVIIENNTTK